MDEVQTAAAAETVEQATLRKAVADADAAEAAAAAARRMEAVAAAPAAVAQRLLAAEGGARDAAASRLGGMLPDLSGVDWGTTSVTSGGQPHAGTGVGGAAILAAAAKVSGDIVRHRLQETDHWRVVVTNRVDLATASGQHRSVTDGIARLTAAAEELLAAAQPPPQIAVAAGAVIAAAAGAIPGAVSLLATSRTITTGSVDFGDLAASIAVVGKLKGDNPGRTVVHDDFRVLPASSQLLDDLQTLVERRGELVERRTLLELLPADPDPAQALECARTIALLAALTAQIDAFLPALSVAPSAGSRSPLAEAVFFEVASQPGTWTLFVKAEGASAVQTVEDRKIREDTSVVVASATISWMLVDHRGTLVDADLSTGFAHVRQPLD